MVYSQIEGRLLHEVEAEIEDVFEEVREIRRYLHMHPEIGFDTQNTEEVVKKFLEKEGIEIIPGQMGVLGLIRGATDDLIALRADMDALCLQEENDVPYRSIYPNKMHACGHDGHTSMLLGAAQVLQKNRERLSFSVLLIFQPAEEGPNLGGARVIMADLERQGIAQKIVGIFGMHLFNDYQTGMLGLRRGSLAASTDEFDVKIIGKGGHAGQPHHTVDALSIGARFISEMESFMSRQTDPLEPAVFSVGIFRSGSAKNIVAGTAEIAGTIRCQSEGTRKLILEGMERILKGTCQAFQADYCLDVLHGIPVLKNSDAAVAYAEQAALQAAGESKTFSIANPMMGAEDFSYFAEKLPAAFAFLGSGNKEKGFCSLAHHPKFDFDEDAMRTGIKMFCCLALGATEDTAV